MVSEVVTAISSCVSHFYFSPHFFFSPFPLTLSSSLYFFSFKHSLVPFYSCTLLKLSNFPQVCNKAFLGRKE